MVKNLTCSVGDRGSLPESGKIPWRREWLSTPVFLPGKSHGQRNLEDYSPWGCKESDTTEVTSHSHTHTHTHTHTHILEFYSLAK